MIMKKIDLRIYTEVILFLCLCHIQWWLKLAVIQKGQKGSVKDIFGPFQKILTSYLPLINLATRVIHLDIKFGGDSHEPDQLITCEVG